MSKRRTSSVASASFTTTRKGFEPSEVREFLRMVAAELARLQDFPLGFEFCGPSSCSKTVDGVPPRTGRRKRIGNAVPPAAAEAIAVECLLTLIASMQGGFRLASGSVWVERAAVKSGAIRTGDIPV